MLISVSLLLAYIISFQPFIWQWNGQCLLSSLSQWNWRFYDCRSQAVELNSNEVGIGGLMIVNLMITGCWFELYCSWNCRFHDYQSYDYRLLV